MTDLRLYIVQRTTALMMVPFIVAHLIVIFYATSNGLSAGEILSRTRGSFGWGAFYAAFVVLAAVHGGIGFRAVLIEWGKMGRRGASIAAGLLGALLLALGIRAVIAVVIA